jgi:hypothetical protein
VNLSEYIGILIDKGYKALDLKPIKCQWCKSKDFERVNIYQAILGVDEFSVKCKVCKKIVGRWAHGGWDI